MTPLSILQMDSPPCCHLSLGWGQYLITGSHFCTIDFPIKHPAETKAEHGPLCSTPNSQVSYLLRKSTLLLRAPQPWKYL